MLLASLDAARAYDHVYIAPHLDDAALSCGGQIALQRDAGTAVLVVTICAGIPAHDARLTPFAQYLHREWALGANPMQRRRDEDRMALATLGCDGLHLNEFDAPYRLPPYGERDAVFGTPAPGDPLGPAVTRILEQLHAQQPSARLYIPLGIGLHVDHLIVCDAGMRLYEHGADVVWYEDAPYAATWPNAIEQRLSMLQKSFEPEVIAIETALERKLRAIAAYQSQQRELFGTASMEQVMAEYAARVAGTTGHFGERVWHMRAGDNQQPL